MHLDQKDVTSGVAVPLVAVVSNPLSTTNNERLEYVRQVVAESANVVHFELQGIETVEEALDFFAKASPSILVINGGDGTIGAVLAAILKRSPFSIVPPIAFLPGGKTNMTAADLGFKGKPEKVLRQILKVARAGALADRVVRRRLIELDMGDGSPVKVGTFFGTAGIVKTIDWCRTYAYSKGLPNWLAHLYAASRVIMSAFGRNQNNSLMRSDAMKIQVVGGGHLDGRFAAVVCTTLDRLLLGLRPYGQEGKGGLRFSAVELGGGNVWRALKGLISGRYGKKSIEGTHVRCADEIRISGTDPVTLDGEIYHPQEGQDIILKGNKSLTFLSLK